METSARLKSILINQKNEGPNTESEWHALEGKYLQDSKDERDLVDRLWHGSEVCTIIPESTRDPRGWTDGMGEPRHQTRYLKVLGGPKFGPQARTFLADWIMGAAHACVTQLRWP